MEVGVGIGVQRWSLHSSAKIARRVTGNLRDSASYHNFTASIISEWPRGQVSDKLQFVAATRQAKAYRTSKLMTSVSLIRERGES
jgi:hypothetical protein